MPHHTFGPTVSAICYSIGHQVEKAEHLDTGLPHFNSVTRFVERQHARMPDYLRFPIRVLTLIFNLCGIFHCGTLFHRAAPEKRARQIAAWRNSRIGVCRDFIRFYESLARLELYSRL